MLPPSFAAALDYRQIHRECDRVTSTLQRYQRIASLYDLLDLPFEYGRYRRIRPLLFAGLSGRILDAGVGTGRNAPFYPAGSSVVGIDLSPAMLARAERRRALSAATIELRQMDVTSLDLPPASTATPRRTSRKPAWSCWTPGLLWTT
jgi:ubiquinone/menaquinone biosynthesis C-methylase UbiE